MQRVLHVLNLDTLGGVEQLFRHYFAYAKHSKQMLHQLLVTSSTLHPFLATKAHNPSQKIYFEKKIGLLPLPKIPYLRYLWLTIQLMRANPDKIVFWNRFTSIAPFKPFKKKGCRLFYYDHGASWLEPVTQENQLFLQEMQALFSISQASKRMLNLKWQAQAPIYSIENPLRPDIQIAREPKKRDPQKTLTLGFAGRLIPLKGCSTLLHAIAHLVQNKKKEIHLLIAGSGPEENALKKSAIKLGLGPSTITFLGALQDMASFYRQIDILVIPSLREPLGLVALEAQACGCPVIASLVDGLPEAIVQGKTGILLKPTEPLPLSIMEQLVPLSVYCPFSDQLIQPQSISPQILAEAILQLAENPQLYDAMSLNCLSSMQKRLNFNAYSSHLDHLILSN